MTASGEDKRRIASAPVVTGFVAALALAFCATAATAQDSAPETGPASEDTAGGDAEDPSRETDIAEDNYRRFMELDDRQLERPPFPVTAYAPRSGLAKLDQLPESSRKHLRNQLRSIILARGPWTPSERTVAYGFVPSEAARQDPALLRQEAEAWAELVAGYHDREAAIYAERSAGAPPPSGAAPSASTDPTEPTEGRGDAPAGADQGDVAARSGGPTGRQGGGAEGGGSEGGATGAGQSAEAGDAEVREVAPPERRRPVSESVTEPPVAASSSPSDEGVEQSAADYLRERGFAAEAGAAPTPEPEDGAEAAADPGRWGEQARDLLPPPGPSETTIASASARDGERPDAGAPRQEDSTEGDGNILTLDELRRARGFEAAGEAQPGAEEEGAVEEGTGEERAPNPPDGG